MKYLFPLLFIQGIQAWNNGIIHPPMGYANWNLLGCDYNDTTIRQIADALVSTGLRDVGYEYVLIQECITPAGHRDSNGVMIPDPAKFPYGMANLADYIHSKGLKAGIYTDVAYRTCANYEGSGPGPNGYPSHWEIDALTFANWGFDMIEADFCNTNGVNLTPQELYMEAHNAIGNAMAATNKTIFFYQCSWGAADSEWTWSPETSNAFRNTPDICGPGSISFGNILRNFDATIIHSSTPGRKPGLPGTGLGAYNDADMLGVGMPGINDIEGRTQFSLWCILGGPLLTGTEVRNMTDYTLATLSNTEAIAINQDIFNIQGMQIDTGDIPTDYQGGIMLNLTTCNSNSLGQSWVFDSDGHVANMNSTNCPTIYDCGNQPQDVVFTYECIANQCGNELWTYNSTSQQIISQVTPTPSSPLCLTAVDPTTSPFSQIIVDTCTANQNTQQWTYNNNDHSLSVTLPSGQYCLTEIINNGYLYMKPLAPTLSPGATYPSQNLALAILNRQSQTVPGYFIDLTLFSFTPNQGVIVRDIWANTTLGPYRGNFTTRELQAHETILLRIYLA